MEFGTDALNSSMSDCNMSFTKDQKNDLLLAMASSGAVSTVMCLIAVILVIYWRLYKYFVYRLALYQVLACLLFSVSESLVLMNYNYNETKPFHVRACLATAFLMQYTMWVKLLFTLCLVFHLFCLAVCLKNFTKLEIAYVLVSALSPLLHAWIPFVNNFYNLAGGWCWIHAWKDNCPSKKYKNGIIEQFTLWYGPLFVALSLCLIAVIMIVLVLARRAYLSLKKEAEPLITENRNKTALKELLPLLVYPIIFFVLAVFPLVDRIYGAASKSKHGHGSYYALLMAHSISQASWGFFSALALIIHVLYVYLRRKIHLKRGQRNVTINRNIQGDTAAYTTYTVASTNAVSAYTIPRESEYENDNE